MKVRLVSLAVPLGGEGLTAFVTKELPRTVVVRIHMALETVFRFQDG